MIAIGVGIAIVIVIILGFTGKTGKETTIPINSTTVVPVSVPQSQTPSLPPITKGKNFSVTLSETVASSAH